MLRNHPALSHGRGWTPAKLDFGCNDNNNVRNHDGDDAEQIVKQVIWMDLVEPAAGASAVVVVDVKSQKAWNRTRS